jgi:hypothetical protein
VSLDPQTHAARIKYRNKRTRSPDFGLWKKGGNIISSNELFELKIKDVIFACRLWFSFRIERNKNRIIVRLISLIRTPSSHYRTKHPSVF